MRKLFSLLGVMLALVCLASPSYALTFRDSTNKTFLQSPLNNTGFETVPNGTANFTVIATPGLPITGIMLSAGATTGIVALYDVTGMVNGATSGQYTNAEVVFEANVPASSNTYIDLSAAPINTKGGIGIVTSGTAGAVVYTGAGTSNI